MDLSDQARHHVALGDGVDQGAFAAGAAHRRQDGARLRIGALDMAPPHRQRQRIAGGAARAHMIDDRERRRQLAVVQRHQPRHPGLARLAALAGEPAPPGQECRQHLPLEMLHRASVAQRAPARMQHQRDPFARHGRLRRLTAPLLGELEPEEPVGRQRDPERAVVDALEPRPAEHLDRHPAAPGGQVDLGPLGRARQVGDAQDHLGAVLPQIGEHRAIGGAQDRHRATAEDLAGLAHRDHALHPVVERRGAARLRLHVDGLIAVDRIHDGRQIEPGRITTREAAVAIRGPLHRRAHAVAIAQIDVVAHADLVAVVDDRGAGQGQEQAVHQLDLAAIVVHQRRQAAPDAEIDAGARIGRIGRPQIVALGVGHHFQRQLVVIAQEQRPLAVRRNVRRLAQDVVDGEAVLLGDRHVDARHQREVERHVAFVALAEIGAHVLRPLVRLGEQEGAGRVGVELGPQLLDDRVGLRQVLVDGAFALAQIRDGIEPETVDAEIEPAAHHLHHRPQDARIVEVEIGLVGEEAVPIVGARLRIEGPVRLLGVGEDDPGVEVLLVGIAPHVPVARIGAGPAAPRPLEPRMLVGGVVDDQLGDDLEAAPLRLLHEAAEVLHRAEVGIDPPIIGDVVAVVAAGARIERQEPQRGDAEVLEIVELRGQAAEVTDPVVVAVEERLDVDLIDHRVLVPHRVAGEVGGCRGGDVGEDVHRLLSRLMCVRKDDVGETSRSE
ncbi:hypothetical protein RHODGE_RHODGE_00450 [Rhodoplanes serenus]|uniref:Uncharacterized protein n=1 Tax=Rhodoplanes serenus TaxID=200615 RepID=A0A3S4AYK5_9BRAD|nr:hypothetical protein RHODGE_RHODGE_00450 [Rhodoplanes serenus]